MLTHEENELLTRVGPGTPCGELMRRYWQPAALCEELPPGGAPLPIRLLGEDLDLFRDDNGRPGLLGIHCAHRGADLSYGRVEDGGLRCIYHGWLYDVHGSCLEQPGEPTGSTFYQKIRHTAYPCQEAGGMVFAYMGPAKPPLLPAFEFLTVPDSHRYVTKIYHECNYMQANEGNLDPHHLPFLHRIFSRETGYFQQGSRQVNIPMVVEETDFGVRLFRMHQTGSDVIHARNTNFILPSLSTIPAGSNEGYTTNWHVPIDDTHHWKYTMEFNRKVPIDPEAARRARSETDEGYRLARRRENRYLQDREAMKAQTFAGLGFAFQAHDLWATEGEGPIQDRTQEHLGSIDRAIIAMRKALKGAIEDVQAGRDPPLVIRDPAQNRLGRTLATAEDLPSSADWVEFLREKIRAQEPEPASAH